MTLLDLETLIAAIRRDGEVSCAINLNPRTLERFEQLTRVITAAHGPGTIRSSEGYQWETWEAGECRITVHFPI